MFLDHILRPAEVKKFEATLKPHQLAKIAISSNDRLASAATNDNDDDTVTSTRTGPATVLDRAVMEHNLLASSKIYRNITFKGLGALLDLTPGAAETMARKMIEQGRLRGYIDQVDRLIWFEGNKEEDDAQGKAGGFVFWPVLSLFLAHAILPRASTNWRNVSTVKLLCKSTHPTGRSAGGCSSIK